MIVGYVNYEYNEERERNLGKTVYVSTSEGEVIKVENNIENKTTNEEYIFLESSKDIFSNIRNNTKKIEEALSKKGYDVIVNINPESNECYIYLKNNTINEEEIKQIIMDIINISKEKIIVKAY